MEWRQDPTKKIEGGKKKPYYQIHYQGWNDRYEPLLTILYHPAGIYFTLTSYDIITLHSILCTSVIL